ncbi:MAG: SRPBCC family protein [Halobacterium sp.]
MLGRQLRTVQTVTATRVVDAPPDAVRDAMLDVRAFVAAAGFDDVAVDGDRIHVQNRVGVASIELELERRDPADATLGYTQTDGIFEEMTAWYRVDPAPEGAEVTATTEFALDVALVGSVLDATVVKRQRRRELEAQLDYLETATEDA